MVRPEGRARRRCGVVAPELLGWLDDRAEEGLLRIWTSADDGACSTPSRSDGFEEARHSYRMEIALDDEAAPRWPDGIAVRTFEPDDERALYDVVTEVWQDTSDPWQESFEELGALVDEARGLRPVALVPRVRQGRARGVLALQPDDVDPNAGYVNLLGVRRLGGRRGSARRSCSTRSARSASGATRGNARRGRFEPDRSDAAVRARRDDGLPRHGLPGPSRARVLGLSGRGAVPAVVVLVLALVAAVLIVVPGVRRRTAGRPASLRAEASAPAGAVGSRAARASRARAPCAASPFCGRPARAGAGGCDVGGVLGTAAGVPLWRRVKEPALP